MGDLKRVFIFGAGFSKPAGMPLAIDLLPLLVEWTGQQGGCDEMQQWLRGFCERLDWMRGGDGCHDVHRLNIEEFFHYARFDAERYRLERYGEPEGRRDSDLAGWLRFLEDALRDVIFDHDDKSDLAKISRWADNVTASDTILTFNYDTLVERALACRGMPWNHGMGADKDKGAPIYKLHGSIDWIVTDGHDRPEGCDFLSGNSSEVRSEEDIAKWNEDLDQLLPDEGDDKHAEDWCLLWRWKDRCQLKRWLPQRDWQLLPRGAVSARTVGIGGLGTYKPLHQLPGLGHVWVNAMRSLGQADLAVVVGFSMSNFDAMAQMTFAEVACARFQAGRPLPVIVIDPSTDGAAMDRFRSVFRDVKFITKKHQEFDWSTLG